MIKINPMPEKILLALAEYKFLWVDNMIDLGITKYKSNLSNAITFLEKRSKPFISHKEFGDFQYGKKPYVYYLTRVGAKMLQDNYGIDARYPKSSSIMSDKDYMHRKYTVDTHVKFNQSLDLNFMGSYYDFTGSNRTGNSECSTKIKVGGSFIIPDLILMGENLFLIEIENGKDSKKSYDKMKSYLDVLETGVASDSFGIKKNPRIVFVFEHKSTMTHTIRRCLEDSDFNNFKKNFLIKDLSEYDNFSKNWKSLGDSDGTI